MPNTYTHTIQSTHVYDCTISTCMLADWTFTRYHTPGKSEYAVVYGTVAQDGSGRFAAGSRIRTSPVTLWAAPLAHTHNSAYCLPDGAGCFCDLPATLQSAIDSLGYRTCRSGRYPAKRLYAACTYLCLKPPVSAFR